jgi:hypothetical protein
VLNELTNIGLKAFVEALIPTNKKGSTIGKLKTGAKNPAPSALVATAPMKVKTDEIPPVTKINNVVYGRMCSTGIPMKNANISMFTAVRKIMFNHPYMILDQSISKGDES